MGSRDAKNGNKHSNLKRFKPLSQKSSNDQFPFPYGIESNHLAWIRDHASYLTVGGAVSHLAGVGTYLFGTLKNLLVVAPIMLMMALTFGKAHFLLLDHPVETFIVMSFGVGGCAWVARRFQNKKSEGVVKRLSTERTIGWFVVGGICGALTALTPIAVELSRDQVRDIHMTLSGVLGTIVAAAAGLELIRSIVPLDNSKRRAVIMWGMGAAGFGVFAIILLVLINFVVYGNPLRLFSPKMFFSSIHWELYGSLTIALGVLAFSFLVVIVRVWCFCPNWQDHVTSICLVLLPAIWLVWEARNDSSFKALLESTRQIGELSRPLASVVGKSFDGLSLPSAVEPAFARLQNQKTALDQFYETESIESGASKMSAEVGPWATKYFGMAMQFVDNGYELLDVGGVDKFKLRQILAQADRQRILGLAETRLPPTTINGNATVNRLKLACQREVLFRVASRLYLGSDRHQLTPRTSTPAPFSHDQRAGSNSGTEQKPPRVGDPVSNEFINKNFPGLTGPRPTLLRLPDTKLSKRIRGILGAELVDIGIGFVNARHEAEYRSLLGFPPLRSDQKPARMTIDYRGSTPYVAATTDSSINAAYAPAVRRSLLNTFVVTCTPKEFRKLCSDQYRNAHPLLKAAIVDAEIVKKLQKFTSEQLTEIAIAKAFVDTSPNESDIQKQILAVVKESSHSLDWYARYLIIGRALDPTATEHEKALQALAKISVPSISAYAPESEQFAAYTTPAAQRFEADELIRIGMAKFTPPLGSSKSAAMFVAADRAVLAVSSGRYGDMKAVATIRRDLTAITQPILARFFLLLATMIAIFCFCFVDINANSIHGFYRDRLSQAFLLQDCNGQIRPDLGIKLSELCEADSVGPYPLINTAINLQGSANLRFRDRKSDFFVFSKYFCGGERSGYVSTQSLEAAYPRCCVNTAMAVSAAAASPNMGRMTNGFMVMALTLLNVRLGYWIPNPRKLSSGFETPNSATRDRIGFEAVFKKEFNSQIRPRWQCVYENEDDRVLNGDVSKPSSNLNLVGLAFSGGGIRSASLNLGIVQSLHRSGVFKHVDYLSTVSGGGYTGCSIATAMRKSVVTKVPNGAEFQHETPKNSIRPWHLPILNIAREMFGALSEDLSWVNLSDGGHIENLAAIELLRRRCRIVIIGDGEADPEHSFNGVGTLIRLARLELNLEIDLNLDELRLQEDGTVKSQWAVGRILYPEGEGFLLYLKSSLKGDENELIKEYRSRKVRFPHEPTADQFFDIGQFEAYRSLGTSIGANAIAGLSNGLNNDVKGCFDNFPSLLKAISDACKHTVAEEKA